MSTFKMTFSLASLILILGLVFATAPVMAHPVTATNNVSGAIHDGDAEGLNHTHPVVEVVIDDANPNTPAIEVIDKAADTEVDTSVNATIEFDVIFRFPIGTQTGATIADADIAAVAYDMGFLPVGTGTAGAVAEVIAQGTLDDDGMFTAGTDATDRDWQVSLTLTIAGEDIDTSTITDSDEQVTARAAVRTAVIADAIEAGLMVDITLNEDVIQMAGLVGGPMAGQSNLESKTTVTVISATVDEAPPELADMAHLIVVRDIDNPPDFGTANPALLEWAEMPDLYELFIENTSGGGSLQLTLISTAADGTTSALKKADDSAFGARAVVFSEVMWARDEGMAGQDSEIDNQWIELYNRSGEAIPHSAITFTTQEGRPALGGGIDLISNVVGGGGANWISDKGQNGNSGTTDASGQVTGQKEFISMYRSARDKDGANGGHWGKSSQLYKPNHRGTPGDKEIVAPRTFTATNANRSPIIFSEISNNTNPAYEWIEIKNVSGGVVNLQNYEVTIATTKGANQASHNDDDLIDFTTAKREIPAGGILLVVKTDPADDEDHPLALGWNFGARNTWKVAKPGEANYVRGVNENSARYMVANTFNALPDNGEFVLIMRDEHGRNGSTAHDNIRDVAGFVPGNALKVDTADLFTNLWPLVNFPAANRANNKLAAGTVQRRQYENIDGTKSSADNNNNDKVAFRDDDNGWTGIGYRRNATPSAQNGGTPGYPHDAKQTDSDAAREAVMISEIMYAHTDRTTLQWIELRNTSHTIGVDLSLWELVIVNHHEMMTVDDMGVETMADFNDQLTQTVNLGGRIPPGQSYLIASSITTGRRDSTDLPTDRIRDAGKRGRELLLNPYGFQLTLRTKRDKAVADRGLVDEVGNLMPAPANSRQSNAQSFNDDVAWNLPPDVFNEDGDRISVVRVPGVASGMDQLAWAVYTDTREYNQIRNLTYYGHEDDISSPGHYHGGVLPVSLSKFRPERMRDTGQVVIRWVTESELNNAGFNILRSETRDGQFTKVNTQLIAGQGTTSERTVYEFIDTTAKPNVVYYYQIQDVSLDGDVTTLRTTHLRGNVTAAGKLTTTWSEIKTLRE